MAQLEATHCTRLRCPEKNSAALPPYGLNTLPENLPEAGAPSRLSLRQEAFHLRLGLHHNAGYVLSGVSSDVTFQVGLSPT